MANDRLMTERVVRDEQGSGCGLIADTVLAFSWQVCGRQRRSSANVAGL
jgi:hypothetical protein